MVSTFLSTWTWQGLNIIQFFHIGMILHNPDILQVQQQQQFMLWNPCMVPSWNNTYNTTDGSFQPNMTVKKHTITHFDCFHSYPMAPISASNTSFHGSSICNEPFHPQTCSVATNTTTFFAPNIAHIATYQQQEEESTTEMLDMTECESLANEPWNQYVLTALYNKEAQPLSSSSSMCTQPSFPPFLSDDVYMLDDWAINVMDDAQEEKATGHVNVASSVKQKQDGVMVNPETCSESIVNTGSVPALSSSDDGHPIACSSNQATTNSSTNIFSVPNNDDCHPWWIYKSQQWCFLNNIQPKDAENLYQEQFVERNRLIQNYFNRHDTHCHYDTCKVVISYGGIRNRTITLLRNDPVDVLSILNSRPYQYFFMISIPLHVLLHPLSDKNGIFFSCACFHNVLTLVLCRCKV